MILEMDLTICSLEFDRNINNKSRKLYLPSIYVNLTVIIRYLLLSIPFLINLKSHGFFENAHQVLLFRASSCVSSLLHSLLGE